MADFFEHYPSSPDELVGIAGELVRHSRGANVAITHVQHGVNRATDAIDGDLTFPMEQSSHPVVYLGRDVAAGAYFASGAIMRFAEAVKTYNTGVDRLNKQIPEGEFDTLTGGRAETLHVLEAEQARLEGDLDDEAGRVAAMLERGPNAKDLAYLKSHGYLMPLDPKDLPAIPTGSPADIRAWWAGLTLAHQAALIAYAPRRLGNLNGLPAEVRDEANRIVLAEDYAALKAKDPGKLTSVEMKALANMEKILGQLAEREAHKDPITGEPVPVQLYIYDPYAFDGDGRVAIAVGNLDEADHVAVNVRGATNTQGLSATRTENMYDQSRWASGDSVAVLDWMGYDAPNTGAPDHPAWDIPETGIDQPDSFGVSNTWMADAGAQQLAADVAGLQASRSDDPAHLTVVGHSYGSTTAAIAAEEYGMRPNDLVLIGSPGVPADEASDLGIEDGHTWVGRASHDSEASLGSAFALGNEPADSDFGANRFRAEHVEREDTDDNHSASYYGRNSEGLSNIAAIVTGQYGNVVEAPPLDSEDEEDGEKDPEYDRKPHHVGHLPKQPLPTPEPTVDRRYVP
ncbi:MAG TPA: alpha/beta hydrolase [Nocardioidaceae bacterium]|nr:alpha/beta hydrolase [Nocardioidaceae bacterium]